MILPGVNEVILAHMKLDPGIPLAPIEHKIRILSSNLYLPYIISNHFYASLYADKASVN